MDEFATFTAADGTDARSKIQSEMEVLSTPTTGDMLFVGQIFRSRIRQRTAQGIDVDGSPFTSYSTKGPYYLYPNREAAGSTRRPSGAVGYLQSTSSAGESKLAKSRAARATAAKNRHSKTGKSGELTGYGIKYESYAAAKAAHGDSTVNEYGMEQHTHMLDTIMVKAGGMEIDAAGGMLLEGDGPLDAWENNQPNSQVTLGFYGPEAERAQGQDEGNSKTPKRHFFGVNQEDLDVAARAVAERMMIRARGIR